MSMIKHQQETGTEPKTDCDFDLTEVLSQFSHGLQENSDHSYV